MPSRPMDPSGQSHKAATVDGFERRALILGLR
jgi:hypothetical protein